ncbi:rab guanine nucleotide exchange factor S2 [Nowakowskiella sp. JEL0407]|nr:rab guanine nucleotide exchange factor S2 [Nowakowskiella sp. JEL0407]
MEDSFAEVNINSVWGNSGDSALAQKQFMMETESPTDKYNSASGNISHDEAIKKLKYELKKANKKISELTEQKKDENEKRSTEKDSLNDIIQSKNHVIDVMRIKINRYEFAIKEAILFLSKPMDAYDGWLKNKPDEAGVSVNSGNGEKPPALHAITAGLNSAISGVVATKSTTTASSAPLAINPEDSPKSRSNSNAPKGSKPTSSPEKGKIPEQNPVELTSTTVATRLSGASTFEIQCLECMRLGLNYLKNAQASIQAMSVNSGGATVNEESQNVDLRLNSETPYNIASIDNKPANEAGVSQPLKSLTKKDLEKDSEVSNLVKNSDRNRSISNLSNNKSLPRRTSVQLTSQNTTIYQHLPDEEDSDLSTATSRVNDVVPKPTDGKCANCRELMLNVDNLTDNVEYLKRDITTLANQLEEERAAREGTQLSKDILEQELEELTAQLFDQANRMVVEEARLRDDLENANKMLRGELKDWVKKVDNREDELRELKKSLLALERAKQKSMAFSAGEYNSSNVGGMPISFSLNAGLSSLCGSPTASNNNLAYPEPKRHLVPRLGAGGMNLQLSIPIDGILFSEFQDHIKQISAVTSPAQILTTILSSPFMKRCMHEDVEPCLFYSYMYPNIPSGSSFKAGTMSSSFKKKLLDSIQKRTCEIESKWSSTDGLPREKSALNKEKLESAFSKKEESTDAWGLTSPPPKSKCCVCIINRECDFQIRFGSVDGKGIQSFSEWNPLCRCCRDRVGATSDFFTYITQHRNGTQPGSANGITILAMFRYTQWLRRRMAIARVGSMSLFDADNVGDQQIQNIPTVGSEWEKFVQIIS